jgi:hypothetical protein
MDAHPEMTPASSNTAAHQTELADVHLEMTPASSSTAAHHSSTSKKDSSSQAASGFEQSVWVVVVKGSNSLSINLP